MMQRDMPRQSDRKTCLECGWGEIGVVIGGPVACGKDVEGILWVGIGCGRWCKCVHLTGGVILGELVERRR